MNNSFQENIGNSSPRAREKIKDSFFSSDKSKKNESQKQEIEMNHATLPIELSFENRAPTIPEEIVRIMHRIGWRANIPAYQNIPATSWIPDLRRIGIEKGFVFILRQALDFEQWFMGNIETEPQKVLGKGKPNPRSRFIRYWLHSQFIKPDSYTTGDSETSFPTNSQKLF